MVAKKPLYTMMLVSVLYIFYYLIRIVISSIITGKFPNLSHTHAQFLGIVFIFAIGLVTGIILIVNSFPEVSKQIHGTITITNSASPLEVLEFISTPEEVEIINAVKSLSPKAYKFEIAKKTGLSRMKVHRITTRLAERRVFVIAKNGRYSYVSLAEWLVT